MNRCSAFEDRLLADGASALDAGDRKHLESCDACRALAFRESALSRLLESGHDTGDLWPAIEERLDEPLPDRAAPRSYRSVQWAAAAAATLLFLILTATWIVEHPASRSEPALPQAGRAPAADDEGPDLILRSATRAGKPAMVTMLRMEDDETVIFLQSP